MQGAGFFYGFWLPGSLVPMDYSVTVLRAQTLVYSGRQSLTGFKNERSYCVGM